MLSGAPAPAALRRDTLVKTIAYERQARSEGDLSPRIRRELRTIALGQRGQAGPKLSAAAAYAPGARLIRSWRGALHEVTVREDGYEWRGEVYRSLSRIAREITGTRWNGLTFFGARRAATPPTDRADRG